MDNQQAERMRALWKSARDKYLSFFAVLEEVRHEIGNDALPAWCVDNLRIGMSVIVQTRKLLTDTDAEIAKRNLAASAAAAKEQARRAKEEAAHRRELEKQARATEAAEARARAERAKEEAERARSATKKARDKETRRQKDKDPQRKAKRQKRVFASHVSDAELAILAKDFKKADGMCRAGDAQWIDGSVYKAMILCAVRQKISDNQEFGSWCDANIPVNHNDRAALINLGDLGEARLREIFAATDRRSYQYIWREHNRPPPRTQGRLVLLT